MLYEVITRVVLAAHLGAGARLALVGPRGTDPSGVGGFVKWYGLDIDQLFGAMRDRSGGGVNLLNHPRNNFV